jgi:hypothetical protein
MLNLTLIHLMMTLTQMMMKQISNYLLKVITVLLMPQLTLKANVKRDSGSVPNKWDGKWINSLETLILRTTKTQ